MIFLSEFYTSVLMCFNNKASFLLATLYIILDVNPIYYLCIKIYEIYNESLINPLDLSNILVDYKLNNIVYLSVIIMFQSLALFILIIHNIIFISKLIKFIKNHNCNS